MSRVIDARRQFEERREQVRTQRGNRISAFLLDGTAFLANEKLSKIIHEHIMRHLVYGTPLDAAAVIEEAEWTE